MQFNTGDLVKLKTGIEIDSLVGSQTVVATIKRRGVDYLILDGQEPIHRASLFILSDEVPKSNHNIKMLDFQSTHLLEGVHCYSRDLDGFYSYLRNSTNSHLKGKTRYTIDSIHEEAGAIFFRLKEIHGLINAACFLTYSEYPFQRAAYCESDRYAIVINNDEPSAVNANQLAAISPKAAELGPMNGLFWKNGIGIYATSIYSEADGIYIQQTKDHGFRMVDLYGQAICFESEVVYDPGQSAMMIKNTPYKGPLTQLLENIGDRWMSRYFITKEELFSTSATIMLYSDATGLYFIAETPDGCYQRIDLIPTF